MKRCLPERARLALAAGFAFAALALAGLADPAAAQSLRRDAPRDVVLAKMTVGTPPQIAIDGKPDRLSPGSRIRDPRNMLVLSGSLAGKTVPVVYRRDAAGLVHEAWILTDEEYRALGGTASTSSPESRRRFAELLGQLFGMRP